MGKLTINGHFPNGRQASEGLVVLSGLDVIDGTPCLAAWRVEKWMGWMGSWEYVIPSGKLT